MKRMLRSAGISAMALLMFAFPNVCQSGDWLDQYIAATAIGAGEFVDVDSPQKSTIDALLKGSDLDAENQGTMDKRTYMPLEGME